MVEKATGLHRKTVEDEEGHPKSVLCSVTRFRPAAGSVGAMLQRAATLAAPERRHGGEREHQADPPAPASRPWRCPLHPDAPRRVACTVCGAVHDEGEDREAAPCGAQDGTHGDAGAHVGELPVNGALAAPHSPPAVGAGRASPRPGTLPAEHRPEDARCACGAPPRRDRSRCPACAPAAAARLDERGAVPAPLAPP